MKTTKPTMQVTQTNTCGGAEGNKIHHLPFSSLRLASSHIHSIAPAPPPTPPHLPLLLPVRRGAPLSQNQPFLPFAAPLGYQIRCLFSSNQPPLLRSVGNHGPPPLVHADGALERSCAALLGLYPVQSGKGLREEEEGKGSSDRNLTSRCYVGFSSGEELWIVDRSRGPGCGRLEC